MPGPDSCPRCEGPLPAGARFCQECGAAIRAGAPAGAKANGAPKAPAKRKAAGPKRAPSATSRPTTWLAGGLAVLLLGALVIGGLARFKPGDTPAPTAPLTAIEGAGPIPAWLASAPREVIADYAWAAAHHDELQYFPCYCGCFSSAGHVSNSECYFRRGGGKILAYDNHAYG